MDPKGFVKVKDKLQYSTNVFDDHSNYINQVLVVMDIAVDGSSYLCLNKDKTMLGDIDKRDVCFYFDNPKKSFFDLIREVMDEYS